MRLRDALAGPAPGLGLASARQAGDGGDGGGGLVAALMGLRAEEAGAAGAAGGGDEPRLSLGPAA